MLKVAEFLIFFIIDLYHITIQIVLLNSMLDCMRSSQSHAEIQVTNFIAYITLNKFNNQRINL